MNCTMEVDALADKVAALQIQHTNDQIVTNQLTRRWYPHHLPVFDGVTFLDLIRQTGGVIAGSFVIDCVLGTDFASDVDVFVPQVQMAAWIKSLGSAFWPGCQSNGDRYGDLPEVTGMFRWGPLNVMFCTAVDVVIDSFDLDICKATYDGHQFLRCDQLAARAATILRPFEVERYALAWRIERIVKYHRRGFTMKNTRLLEPLGNLAMSSRDERLRVAMKQLMTSLVCQPQMFRADA